MPELGDEIGRRLLLVEDSASDAALFAAQMDEVGGWELTHSETLAQASEALNGLSFDVVVLDLGLPDARGSEALHDLRARFDVPIVVLTGRPEREVGDEVITSGAQDFLSKGTVDPDRLARSLRHAMQRHSHSRKLERVQRRLQRYARAVAHDVRGPLTSIRGFAELIRVEERSAGREDGRSAEYADRIVDQSKRLLDMVKDLLEEPDDADGESVVDVTSAARWVEEVIGDRLDEVEALMTVTRLPRLRGDRTTIRQMLLNLTTNALKHATPPEDRRLELRWSSQRRDDGGWDVVLEDNGTDVDPDLLASGQPLPVADVRPGADGHGMGLRVVAAGVAEHDGRAWLTRGRTGGLRITLAFPASRTVG